MSISLQPVRIGCRIWNFVIRERWNTHSDLCALAGSLVNTPPVTCHWAGWRKCFSESMGSRFGGPGQKALPSMNDYSLFCGFLPNPFIQDLLLWCTSQEFVKTDLYPLSLISVRYAICSTGRWSILGRCFGACQQSNCAYERQP